MLLMRKMKKIRIVKICVVIGETVHKEGDVLLMMPVPVIPVMASTYLRIEHLPYAKQRMPLEIRFASSLQMIVTVIVSQQIRQAIIIVR